MVLKLATQNTGCIDLRFACRNLIKALKVCGIPV